MGFRMGFSPVIVGERYAKGEIEHRFDGFDGSKRIFFFFNP
jgi:hypothetical protein